jgi:hypothetical protein
MWGAAVLMESLSIKSEHGQYQPCHHGKVKPDTKAHAFDADQPCA